MLCVGGMPDTENRRGITQTHPKEDIRRENTLFTFILSLNHIFSLLKNDTKELSLKILENIYSQNI